MAKLTLTDLPVKADLDLAASQKVNGGMMPMGNIIAMFETMVFTQNASTFTIVNDGVGGSAFTNISNSALSAASPMSVFKMSMSSPSGEESSSSSSTGGLA